MKVDEKQYVATCPGCHARIEAAVELDVRPGTPVQDPDNGRWSARASVTIVAVRMDHACSIDDPNPITDALAAVVEGARAAGAGQ